MTKRNIAIMLPPTEMQETKASSTRVIALEILQENFASDAERDVFLRAMAVHGVTLLRAKDSLIKKIVRAVSRLWLCPYDKTVRP